MEVELANLNNVNKKIIITENVFIVILLNFKVVKINLTKI